MADDTLTVLRSIDQSLRALVILAQGKAEQRVKSQQAAPGLKIASDADLDSQYGDPVIKAKDPRDWSGPSMKDRHFSECPADYLEMLADRLEWFAEKEEREGALTTSGKPKWEYSRKDAARARGWAARIRSGKHTPPPVDDDGGIPDGW